MNSKDIIFHRSLHADIQIDAVEVISLLFFNYFWKKHKKKGLYSAPINGNPTVGAIKKCLIMGYILPEKIVDQIGWHLKFGMPKRKLSNMDLRYNGFNMIDRPVFFLSTGRTGTQWFNGILNKDSKFRSFHEPVPSLFYQWKLAFDERESILQKVEPQFNLFREIFLVAREEYRRYAWKTGKRYAETNNYVTFFAPVIAEALPSAKFVHVYRHPGEFIRSGLRRNWYGGGENDFVKPGNKMLGSENRVTAMEKIAWLWRETNQFIELFKKSSDNLAVYSFNFNELNLDRVMELTEFLELSVKRNAVKRRIGIKMNVQKEGNIDKYSDWKTEDKIRIMNICGELATQYGYDL